MKKIFICFLILFCTGVNTFSQKKNIPKPIPPLEFKDGKLSYEPDSLGNRIPDFSYAGYGAGEKPIPLIGIKVVVPLSKEDATENIQKALDCVSSMKPDANGFRGTVLLQAGEYKVAGSLYIRNSGVVLRGCGAGDNGTKLIATGKDRRTLIRILGRGDRMIQDTIPVKNTYVPVNSTTLNIPVRHGLKVGDKILIQRPSTKEWIEKLGTAHFGGGITALGWKPGDHDIYWDRTVTSVNNDKIVFDAPITTSLDAQYGGGYVLPYTWNGRVSNVGIENLACISEYNRSNVKDESHSWMAITIENAMDVWVRNTSFRHFAGSAVMVLETAKRITVENCKSLDPISEIGGHRRYTFFTSGQQCLFQRLYAENGYHDFAVGFCAPGPNAFVQCYSELPYSFSGAVDSWASGILFDIVNANGNALCYKNRMQENQGTGWSAANSVFWQCSASLIECFAPPMAQNWAFGSWSEFSGNGYWNESNNHIQPRSLYYQQLKERLGSKYTDRANLLPFKGEASSSPKVEVAAELTKKAYEPVLTLSQWIDKLNKESNITTAFDPSLIYKESKQLYKPSVKTSPLTIKNGWLTRGNSVQTGLSHSIQWWSGNLRPTYLKKNKSHHLTRFVPGRVGVGLTDDIDSVAKALKENHYVAIDHNYGLWYDRRRDDHERIRRINGEVWAPFYEQPFARSGQGIAYDGLSKYDLTKFNDWYWMRLRRFADVADKEGLILLHQNYFQHNIIEAGAHWADSPWRPANNINNTGFPEPVPYAGDKRIFFAEQFYDINHPVRRELHKKYIRQCLNNFRGNTNVIQLISAEFTGPLHFVEFWLDVISEWEQETGDKQLIALSTTKDVQDAILADPVRSKMVDVIDIRYWFYREDGTAYEPKGGQNLAPRQHARLTKPGKVSFASVYKAVSEYREKYPDKAVVYYSNMYPQQAWASFMAGGSLACLPTIDKEGFLEAASAMKTMAELNTENQYVLGNPEKGYIIYTENGNVQLNINTKDNFELYWIDTKTGKVVKDNRRIKGDKQINISHSVQQDMVAWLVKNNAPVADEKEVYMFTSFREPATDGLRFIYSYDGYKWDSIPGVFLKPEAGAQKIMRDPSIVTGPDGTFHLVWTCSWKGDPGFGYASSKDLINWSEQQHIPVMAFDATTVNVWAPELFYDDENKDFIVVWASTIPFKFEKGIEDEYNNHRLYYTKTKNFKDFTKAEILYNPGYSSIDAIIVKKAPADYVLVFKDNTRPERNMHAAFAKSATGPYNNPTEKFTANFTEGPSAVKVGNEWLIYFDAYEKKSYDAVSTGDFKTFTDVNDKISVPEGHKHGTIFKVKESILKELLSTTN